MIADDDARGDRGRPDPTTDSVNEAGGHGSAADLVPPDPSLERLRDAARSCEACDLYRRATRTVFGEGLEDADLVLVGEQPGDHEDLEGHPFVGPAGKLLDRALAEAGIDRSRVHVTNAVKHFKWKATAGGKRRLHEKPNRVEMRACAPWLEAELRVVQPRVIVCLGATAAQALLGPPFRVTVDRGRFVPSPWPAKVLATIHPSAVLRAPDGRRPYEFGSLVADLWVAAEALLEPTDG